MSINWKGVFPAVTTKFKDDYSLDYAGTQKGVEAQIAAGCHGIITTGTLGEASTLSYEEKQEVLRIAVETANGRVPVLMGAAFNTTMELCQALEDGQVNGADGFMVLPAMLYAADRRETIEHFRSAARASGKPIMIYNNPIGYKVDCTVDMLEELADEDMLVAIKESSDDVRRITDIVNHLGDRYALFTGVDNLAMESLMMGAVGWVAGLVCAFPEETVAIYNLVQAGRIAEARDIYRWFKPLLDLDVNVKLVQNIKLAEVATGLGTELTRPPRLPLVGEERASVLKVIRDAMDLRPDVSDYV
ncbi:MAG: dihydrodipicolinate synthase family protein [Bacteroidetes Order II. Incertae sedis bacterium]|jgi:1-pyrroline-4-hydroxy-2-carboxylate deaminase|nr:dihydrodipicolinate synthase family protein [Bacteroidetes Order II. bacterium]MDG1754192.1 dihydrodipicolinate synthase family protein [Rhodothermales bacterium]MBT4052245.1 dihydrodipicolinate synthase family protein [Bacteroidetes Order II. bacterium]MBT4603393.1 dihydrodipicolinate synthase family protein [Bacteroidetes Order II. bacterium]MBT5250248.1 dihydrodipicolinate synthase family protein [Bacteroidetes Order II. bacterium]